MLKQINNHSLHGGNKRKLDDYTIEYIDRTIKKNTDKLIYLKKTARRRLLSNCYRKCKFDEGLKTCKV